MALEETIEEIDSWIQHYVEEIMLLEERKEELVNGS